MKRQRLGLRIIIASILIIVASSQLVCVDGIELAQTYTPHDPIQINGNAQFLSMDTLEGWPGNGSPDDPIIISGYSFAAAEHMLRVENCDLHFRFVDNQLDGLSWLWCGIAILNTSNGVIENNYVRRAAAGIHVVTVANMMIRGNEVLDSAYGGIIVENDSENVTVQGNTVYDNENYGIHIGNPYGSETSHNVRILDNIVYDNNPSGIRLLEAEGCIVENNTVFGNTINGIVIESGSHQIRNNTVSDCTVGIFGMEGNATITGNEITDVAFGMSIGTENNTISHNYLSHNSRTGIRFYYQPTKGIGGSNNIVTWNSIANNSEWGVDFASGTSNNIVQSNDFLMNGDSCQACDDGSSNTFEENFWDDWTGPDDDQDGYVDIPYAINGTAENSDASPLASNSNPLPEWYTPKTTPAGSTPLTIDPLLLAAGIGGLVIVVLLVVIVRRR